MDDLLAKKFPSNYGERVIAILEAMSFGGDLMVLGSGALRSQQYTADYDGYEIVKRKGERDAVLAKLAKEFQDIIKEVKAMKDVWIGDIKVGVREDWRVVPLTDGWNVATAKGKVRQLKTDGIIGADEAKEALALLAKATTKAGRIAAREGIKFQVLRWTPREVLAGSKRCRDGSTVGLAEAMGTPGITKLDVIGWLGGAEGFTDFSVIYEFKTGAKVLNPAVGDVSKSLHESLIYYISTGNYFKALKRQFAIAKYAGDTKRISRLTPVLNSDLGRMYQIVSDIETLVRLLDDHTGYDADDVREEVDGFIARLANIYTLKGYIKDEPRILAELHRILRLPPSQMTEPLTRLGARLDAFLQKYSKPHLEASASTSR
jgi:hypothetical protein